MSHTRQQVGKTKILLIHLVQVGHDNILMLVRCRQSISPCPMLTLSTEQSLCTVEAVFSHKAAERFCCLWVVQGPPWLRNPPPLMKTCQRRGFRACLLLKWRAGSFTSGSCRFSSLTLVSGGISGPTLISVPGSNVPRPGKLTPWASLHVTFPQVQGWDSKERRALREDFSNFNDLPC